MRRIGWKVLTEERERGRVKAIFLERVYFFFLIHIPMKVKTKRQKAFATMVTCAYEKYIYTAAEANQVEINMIKWGFSYQLRCLDCVGKRW